MNVRLALPVIAAVIALFPMTTPDNTPIPAFNGDTYTTIDHCIYDGDGNLTECEPGFNAPFVNPFADLDTSRFEYLLR